MCRDVVNVSKILYRAIYTLLVSLIDKLFSDTLKIPKSELTG